MMASMRDGSGDDWFLLFNQAGAVLKGFSHESPMAAEGTTWAGVLSDVPAVFNDFLTEPAFSPKYTTFCIWRTWSDQQWHTGTMEYPHGPDPDGSAELLSLLDGNPRTYQRWAEEYYEREVSIAAVEDVYAHRPLSAEIVARLNEDIALEDLAGDLTEIGYPS